MKTWLRFGGSLAVALGLALAAGCSGDDGDEAAADDNGNGGTVVVTNIVVVTNGNGNVSQTTNLVFIPLTPFQLLLAAPQQIAPANGKLHLVIAPATNVVVHFDWTDVAGADKYMVTFKEAKDSGYSTIGFYDATPRQFDFPKGTYTWNVCAMVRNKPQTASGYWTFQVK